MNWPVVEYLATMPLIVISAIGLGYVIGMSRGEKSGYRLGYHEGGFDAVHMPDIFERNDV